MEAASPICWTPSTARAERSRLVAFMRWLEEHRGLHCGDYDELWAWSVADPGGFWRAIFDHFDVAAAGDPSVALADPRMPGAVWFPEVRLNYAAQLFEHAGADEEVALLHASELRPLAPLTWGSLRDQVAAVAAGLRGLGVGPGDRVVGYLPNVAEAIVAFLATASLGAVWSSCSPDFGVGSVIDRVAQIEPKVLLAVDGYRYGGRDFERLDTVAELRRRLPSLRRTVIVPYLDPGAAGRGGAGTMSWGELLESGAGAPLRFEPVPFDHPLWVLYSSGTTGLPKAIVQGHGGIVLEHLKILALHLDLGPGDRYFWFTTTGWMMWNFLVSGLLTGAAVVLYDGNPAHPTPGALWDLAAAAGVTLLGTSAAFIAAAMKAGVDPAAGRDLSRLRTLGSTGSPLAPEAYDWVYERFDPDLWLVSISGGTDLCTAFLGGVPTLPVHRGELQRRLLGAAIEAWDEAGRPVTGEVGELVITKPMPSMPLRFWNDPGDARYRETYFEAYPGAWRHGDWIELTPRGTAVVYGRSDATINRGGIRMGTSEIYRAVLEVDEVLEALVVEVPREGTQGWMPLFVVLRDGVELDEELRGRIAATIRRRCSPRHVPDQVFRVEEVPHTLSGKVLEVPVKRILMGTPVERAASRGSLANPGSLDYFAALAAGGAA